MAPPLPPTPMGHALFAAPAPKLVLECFLDLACPFSGRFFETAFRKVAPVYDEKHNKKIQWIFHQVPQPWHPQSTYMHEACFAVKEVAPESFFDYCSALWAVRPKDYTDEVTIDQTRAQIYDNLAELAAKVGVDKAVVRARLQLEESKGGTWQTQKIKWAAKYHRSRGIHVTPTVLVNGIEAGQISSSWTEAQWKEFLDELLASE